MPAAVAAISKGAATRERVVEVQRARVLAAITREAAEHGVGNLSVARVVHRAGVSRRTFYELFADREDCLLAALGDAVARASREVLAGHDPSAPWAQQIRGALAALLSFLDAEPALGRLLIVGSLGAGPRVLEYRERVLARLIEAMARVRAGAKTKQELPPLAEESIVGGALAVVHARMVAGDNGRRTVLLELLNPLMSMILLPYLGPSAARRELHKPAPRSAGPAPAGEDALLHRLPMRLTYRTISVLLAVSERPNKSNRQVAEAAGVSDQGQASKLLRRLARLGLIENVGGTPGSGAPNAWTLTPTGTALTQTIHHQGLVSSPVAG